jgi:CRISPR/Cas system-associated protein endoribonuclease Cas2
MEVIVMEEDYKAKYENLVNKIKEMENQARENVRIFPEPDWPDTIDDRKKVIWFRNDVFEHGYECGAMGAYHRILKAAEES